MFYHLFQKRADAYKWIFYAVIIIWNLFYTEWYIRNKTLEKKILKNDIKKRSIHSCDVIAVHWPLDQIYCDIHHQTLANTLPFLIPEKQNHFLTKQV